MRVRIIEPTIGVEIVKKRVSKNVSTLQGRLRLILSLQGLSQDLQETQPSC